jgi:membrane fusion protein (multidrug efflux system)
MQNYRSKLIVVCVLLAAFAGGYWYLQKPQEPPAAQAAPAGEGQAAAGVAVEAAEVEVGPVVVATTVTGTLRSDEDATISTEISGRVSGIHFSEGQSVEQGDLLFTIDDAIYRAEVATAEANLELSKRNAERARELLQRNAGTERARDEAEAQLAIDQADVNLARTRLEKTKILAPFDGIIGLRQVSVGEYVTPGQDLVNVEDIEPIKVDFRIPERLLSVADTGQRIEVAVEAWPDRTFEGEVFAIDPQISAEGRSIILRARIANEDRLLRPGLFARVRLITERRDDAILVPEQALVPQGGKRFVFKIVDGKVQRTEVEVGERRVGVAEIRSGLAPGDVVVTAGQLKLQDGVAVRVLDEGATAGTGEEGVS